MSIFSKVRQALRGVWRDTQDEREEVCAQLQGLGIDAQTAPRGRAEEKIHAFAFLFQSLGVIEIAEGLVNVPGL